MTKDIEGQSIPPLQWGKLIRGKQVKRRKGGATILAIVFKHTSFALENKSPRVIVWLNKKKQMGVGAFLLT